MTRCSEEMSTPAPTHVRRTDDGAFEIHSFEDHVSSGLATDCMCDGEMWVPKLRSAEGDIRRLKYNTNIDVA